MNFNASYIWAVWKRAKGVNILTLVYMLPFLIAIMYILVTNIFPILAQYSFIKNSDFTYIYDIDFNVEAEVFDELNKDSLFIGYRQTISAYDDEEEYIIGSIESSINVITPNHKLTKTKFTENNFISFSGEIKENNIYLSYDCAKALNLELGDSCKIKFIKYVPDTIYPIEQILEFNISGILKPNYDDSSPYRSPDNNICLALVNEDMFNWLTDNIDYNERYNYIYYSDDMIDFPNKTKGDLLRELKDYYFTPIILISKIATILISFVTLYAILLFELRYIRKKHSRNIRIISTLGLSHKNIRRLYIGLSLTNLAIAYIISFLFFKFVLLDLVMEIYYSFYHLGLMSLVILGFSFIFAYLQSLKIKVV